MNGNYDVYVTPDTQVWAKVSEDSWVCRFNAWEFVPDYISNEEIWDMHVRKGGTLIANMGRKIETLVRYPQV